MLLGILGDSSQGCMVISFPNLKQTVFSVFAVLIEYTKKSKHSSTTYSLISSIGHHQKKKKKKVCIAQEICETALKLLQYYEDDGVR